MRVKSLNRDENIGAKEITHEEECFQKSPALDVSEIFCMCERINERKSYNPVLSDIDN